MRPAEELGCRFHLAGSDESSDASRGHSIAIPSDEGVRNHVDATWFGEHRQGLDVALGSVPEMEVLADHYGDRIDEGQEHIRVELRRRHSGEFRSEWDDENRIQVLVAQERRLVLKREELRCGGRGSDHLVGIAVERDRVGLHSDPPS